MEYLKIIYVITIALIFLLIVSIAYSIFYTHNYIDALVAIISLLGLIYGYKKQFIDL
jgi:hypothetical protein